MHRTQSKLRATYLYCRSELLSPASAALLLMVGIASPLKAQVTTAEILGRVTDSLGATISGAEVILHNLDTGVEQKVAANRDGDYTASLLPIGITRYGRCLAQSERIL